MTIPETCKAAVVLEYLKPIQIQEVKIPTSLERGAILVKIETATLCGTDVHLWDGSLGATYPIDIPVVMGHEMVGRVVKLGEGVTSDSVGQPLKIGDRIIWTHGTCGECYSCSVLHRETLCTHRKVYMMGNVNKPPYLTGGFAEYCYVYPTAARVKVPEEIKNDWASAASCALRTVMSAFERLGEIRHTESIVIQGDGPLGLFAVALARIKGPRKIIAVGGATKRLELAKAWEADETVSIVDTPNPHEREQLIKNMTAGRGADIVFEFSGAKTAFAEGLGFIAAGGRYVVVGQLGGHRTEITPAVIVKKQVNIYGTNSAAVRHYYQALEFMKQYSGKFNFDLMITGRYKLSQINEAIESMRKFQDIKAVLDIE